MANNSSGKRPNLSITQRGFRRFLALIFLVLITGGLIVTTVVALPQTERVFPDTDFDLNLKENDYASKYYIVELNVKPEDRESIDSQLRDSKDIIHERLNRYGVEIVKITDEETPPAEEGTELKIEGEDNELLDVDSDNELKPRFKVVVETTKNMDSVDQLVRTRNYFRIVTPKEDAVFDDPENPIAIYLAENYDSTRFTRHRFRSVVIKELPSSEGDTAFFSIFKPKLLESNDFYDLLDEYAGDQIGISIDGFVTPFQVPFEFNQDAQASNGQGSKPEFAPSVGLEEDGANVADALYNSGVPPARYTVVEDGDLPVTIVKPDYYTSITAILASIVGIMIFIGWRNIKSKDENITFILSVIATYSLWITILKISGIPIDLDIMFFTGFLLIFLIKLFNFRKTSKYVIELSVLGMFLLAFLLGDGYTKLFAQQILFTSILAVLVVNIMRWYANNLRLYLKK